MLSTIAAVCEPCDSVSTLPSKVQDFRPVTFIPQGAAAPAAAAAAPAPPAAAAAQAAAAAAPAAVPQFSAHGESADFPPCRVCVQSQDEIEQVVSFDLPSQIMVSASLAGWASMEPDSTLRYLHYALSHYFFVEFCAGMVTRRYLVGFDANVPADNGNALSEEDFLRQFSATVRMANSCTLPSVLTLYSSHFLRCQAATQNGFARCGYQ